MRLSHNNSNTLDLLLMTKGYDYDAMDGGMYLCMNKGSFADNWPSVVRYISACHLHCERES